MRPAYAIVVVIGSLACSTAIAPSSQEHQQRQTASQDTADHISRSPSDTTEARREEAVSPSSDAISASAAVKEPALPRTIESKDRHGRSFPSQYGCAVSFLDYLATRNEDRGQGFKLAETKDFDIPTMMSGIASDGVTITTATPPRNQWKLSVSQVRTQLHKRLGPAFEWFSHLGYIYSQRYPQYSSLEFKRSATDSVDVLVGPGIYHLRFVMQGADCRLTNLDYLEITWE